MQAKNKFDQAASLLTTCPCLCSSPQRPTSLRAWWISSPTVTDIQGKELLVTLSVMQQCSGHRVVTQRQLRAKLGQKQALQHGRVQVSQLLIQANCLKMEIKWEFCQRTPFF